MRATMHVVSCTAKKATFKLWTHCQEEAQCHHVQALLLYWQLAEHRGDFLSRHSQSHETLVLSSSCASVRCLVCLPAWNNSAPTWQIFIKFDIRAFLETLSRKSEFHSKPKKVTGILHEHLCTVVTTSRWILLRMRNISDKSCRENQNTFYLLITPPPSKVVPLMK